MLRETCFSLLEFQVRHSRKKQYFGRVAILKFEKYECESEPFPDSHSANFIQICSHVQPACEEKRNGSLFYHMITCMMVSSQLLSRSVVNILNNPSLAEAKMRSILVAVPKVTESAIGTSLMANVEHPTYLARQFDVSRKSV